MDHQHREIQNIDDCVPKDLGDHLACQDSSEKAASRGSRVEEKEATRDRNRVKIYRPKPKRN